MNRKVLAATTALAMALGGAAHAATYVSYLEWWDDGGPTQTSRFGEVVLEEAGDGKTVNVTATLYDGDTWQQSGINNLFAFNLTDDGASQVTENYSSPNVIYSAAGYTHAPWGSFTDTFYINASGKNARVSPFHFTVYNPNGLTFAGVDATFGPGGVLTGEGTGNRFDSNAGGWWFVGHMQPLPSGASINIAARDAFCVDGCTTSTAVPEPDAWALMILGFGAAGAAMRHRRRLSAAR